MNTFTGRHISIEGMDGVGKSTVCHMLSERLGFELIEKPLKYLFDENGDMNRYIRIRDYVNGRSDRIFTSWFYGLGSTFLYDRYQGHDVITDRHLISNYMWSGCEESEPIFETLVDRIGAPSLTVVLYARPEAIRQRLTGRNVSDPDLHKIDVSEEVYGKARQFLTKYPMPHLFIDTSDSTPDEICDTIIGEAKRIGVLRWRTTGSQARCSSI